LAELRRLSGKEVCKILTLHNFEEVRRKGSHIILQKKDNDETVTVIVTDHKQLKTGTLLSIIQQSGLSRTLFE
jgi:predicted RNA binding protein YcfA (HicA-like mRNA interferase family)